MVIMIATTHTRVIVPKSQVPLTAVSAGPEDSAQKKFNRNWQKAD